MKDNIYNENLRDQLQAYYGKEILNNSSRWIDGCENLINHSNYLNKATESNKDVGNSEYGKERLNEYDGNNLCDSDIVGFEYEIDVNQKFAELTETKSLKELLIFYNNLTEKIKKDEHEMHNLVYNNYNKLKYLSKFFKSINDEFNVSDVLESLDLNSDSNQCENDSQNCETSKVVDLNKNKVKSLYKILKNIEENVFNDENLSNLNGHFEYHNFITLTLKLKKFDVILNNYYSNNNYRDIIALYSKWSEAIKLLSNETEEFKAVYLESSKIFEKTINTVKGLLIINDNINIENSINSVIKVYNSLCDEKHYFRDEFISNINIYIQNKTNELVIKQLNELDHLSEINQFSIFKNACMHASNIIFNPFKCIIKKLITLNNDMEESIGKVIKHFFNNSGDKLIDFFTHLILYNKIELEINDQFKNVIEGISYLSEFFNDLDNILTINVGIRDEIGVKSDNIDIESGEFAKIYQEWCKQILNSIFSIDNINTKIGCLWESLFDEIVNNSNEVNCNNSLMNTFLSFNKNVIDTCIHGDIFNFITKYYDLNTMDYDSCENLVRRNIKSFFQLIISDSSICIGNAYFSEIKNEYVSCIDNYNLVKDAILVELTSYKSCDKELIDNETGKDNETDSNVEYGSLAVKLSVVDYRIKMKYFILMILTIRHLRKHTLISSIALFHRCFYNKEFTESTNLNRFINDSANNSNSHLEYNLNIIDSRDEIMKDPLISEIREDVSIQIIQIIYKRFELLYINVFVIWNVNTIMRETMESVKGFIGFDEFIDIINAKVSLLIDTLCEFDKCRNNTFSKNVLIKDFIFPLDEHDKSVIYGKWCKNYRILSDFDLNNNKHLNNEFSFWISQIINGVLIEVLSILKTNSTFKQTGSNSEGILIEITYNNGSNVGCDTSYANKKELLGNKESSIKSLTRFWEKINKGFLRYSKEFNIIYSLFCEIYNTIIDKTQTNNKR
ncbi:hypothetical protein RS030_182698 [Cryptosporidium xiaoi]|uniref:Vacuolar protein sorting-associated protein 51 homolog n=1 Tax=Cryptosporidium xiaoi TaxID=659607 RepID=A0AAV9XZ72_9CRYT